MVFDVDPNITLDILRKRIENEARELMPKEFRFMMFSGVIVSLGQEHTVAHRYHDTNKLPRHEQI